MTNKQTWQEEFDKKFEGIYYGKDNDNFPNYPPEGFIEDVKSFITQQLLLRREKEVKLEMLKEIDDIFVKIEEKKTALELQKQSAGFPDTRFVIEKQIELVDDILNIIKEQNE